jgi:small subunit ribosomal protein S6
LTHLYEGMFLLDNQVVREDWKKAKALVTEVLEKHGAKMKCARRWDERKLAYPIKNRHRGTYLLAYYEVGGDAGPNIRRDFDLSERVLRYLIVSCDAVPEGEMDLAAAEQVADFAVPAPPPDDAVEPAPMRRREEGDEPEIFVPDLENLPAEDNDGAHSRGRRPEAKAPTGA